MVSAGPTVTHTALSVLVDAPDGDEAPHEDAAAVTCSCDSAHCNRQGATVNDGG